jgi:AraC-like DNA-binding protein
MNLIYNKQTYKLPMEQSSFHSSGSVGKTTIGEKFGFIDFSPTRTAEHITQERRVTKIIYLKAGSELSIDMEEFRAIQDEIFFLRPDQYLQLGKQSSGCILYYTDQLYFADLEDQELLYGGILFNSSYNKLSLKLNPVLSSQILSFFETLKTEIVSVELNQESMVRGLIKQLIVLSLRAWKIQYARLEVGFQIDPDFTRLFDRLVEQNFRTHHTVAAYASMLHITPKALTKRFVKCGKCTPSEVIRKRIVLEAKRMLVHTALNVKEIGYKLGYEDPCYFIRFFTKQVNMAPQTFRRYFQSGLTAVA